MNQIKATSFLQDLGFSIKRAQSAIDKGRLLCNGVAVNKTAMLEGEVILYDFMLEALDFNFQLVSSSDFMDFRDSPFFRADFIEPLFCNEYFCVFNKPPNLLSHPKGRFAHVSLCDSMYKYLGKNATLAHRLDYETSGLVICARDKKHDAILKEAIAWADKIYLAWVSGIVRSDMELDFPIKTPKKEGKKIDLGIRSSIAKDGKPSLTLISPLKYDYANNATLLKVTPKTGRTHQIRLHLSHINHPIIGESLYVDDELARQYLKQKLHIKNKNKLWLHASSITFNLFGEKYYFTI